MVVRQAEPVEAALRVDCPEVTAAALAVGRGRLLLEGVPVAVAVGGGKARIAGTRRPEMARAMHEKLPA